MKTKLRIHRLLFLRCAGLFVHGRGWVWFEDQWLFHLSCIENASKGSKSKSKCLIEFTLNTCMKYLFFDSS